MYPVERRRLILERARSNGRVEVAEISLHLQVAPETIRRDLHALEQEGLLRRVHGGAVPVGDSETEISLSNRSVAASDEKLRIADTARSFCEHVDSVFLDEGSTVGALAENLWPARPLTVVTAALPLATRLAPRPNIKVLLLGGRVRAQTLGCVDHWALRMLEDFIIDLAILGTTGISARHGLTCPDSYVAAVKSQAVAVSRRRVLLADHSKFGVESFSRFAALRDINTLVTDRGTRSEQLRLLQQAGIEVVFA